jgi:hypothetical protein
LIALSHPAVSLAVGIIGAAALLLFARRGVPSRENLAYGLGLGVTAVMYVVFALLMGAPGDHLEHELVGTILFGGAAVLGAWRWPALLALGWIAHPIWDLAFHFAGGPDYSPAWYALFCVGFDLPVGGYVAARIEGARAPSRRY